MAARTHRRGGRALLGHAALLAAFGVLLAVTVGPRLFGYRLVTMLSGSMAPRTTAGDLLVDVAEPITALRVGQVVTYHVPVGDRHVESHRVVWVGHDARGAVLFRTRGDANAADDPWTARASEPTIWRVRGVVPWAGAAIRALRTPVVQLLVARILPALVVAWLLVSIWRRPVRRA